MSKLLRTHMLVYGDHKDKRELTICLHPNRMKMLFLDRDYNGFFIDLAIVHKFSFDEKRLYLKLGNCTLAFERVPGAGTDEDYKNLIKEMKTIKAECQDSEVFYASSYLGVNEAHGIATREYLEETGVDLPAQHEHSAEDIIAEFEASRKDKTDLQSQINAITNHVMEQMEEADNVAEEVPNETTGEEPKLSVEDIMKEVHKMSSGEETYEMADEQKTDEIPEGFKMVGGDEYDATLPTYNNQEDEAEEETEEETEEVEEKPAKKKKSKGFVQNLTITMLILLIIALGGMIALILTGNLDKVLDLIPIAQ